MIISPDRFLADLETLGRIGWVDGEGMDRPAFSPSYGMARKFVEEKMRETGLAVTVDGANLNTGGATPPCPPYMRGLTLTPYREGESTTAPWA